MSEETTVGPGGAVVIPAAVLHEGGIEVGDAVLVHVEDGRIVVETRAQLAARTRRDVSRVDDGGSVVEEFLAERRQADRDRTC